jgi:hypothetical protein
LVFILLYRFWVVRCQAHLRRMAGRTCGAFLFLCIVSSPAAAQSLIADDPKDLYHWAYAAAFGTGAYRIGESDLFAVRINPKVTLTTFKEGRVALKLRLPVTFGLQTIDIQEIASTPIAEQFATLSVVPGLGLSWQATSRWTLNPYVNYGWGTELQGESSAWIYFAGLNSRFLTRFDHLDLTLLNGVQWLGHNPDSGPEDKFARLINGLEIDLPLGNWELKGKRLELKPHVVHYWYFNDLDFSVVNQAPVELNQEIEVALALGTRKHMSLWLFKFDRFGIGYRKGDEIEGVRLFLDSVFD